MQKKSRNSRGKTREMETHFYTMDFFFLSIEFSYEHSETFPTIYFYGVSISRIMNAKGISKFKRETPKNFFSFTRISYGHSQRLHKQIAWKPTFFPPI